VDKALVEKYLKVKALALRGSPGEKDNANRILKKLEADHPGISKAAADLLRKQAKESEQEVEPERPKKPKPKKPKAPSGVWPKEEEETENPFESAVEDFTTGNWENLFRNVQAAFYGVYGFAENVAQAYAGKELANEVEVETKMGKTGLIHLSLKLPLSVYNRAIQLNAIQRAAFRQTLHEYLDAQLDALFGHIEG
jgi:hypothetical protein